MAKSKKKAKSAFSRFSKQQLIVAGIFILGFGGFGVWKLAFSSAATPPPYNMTTIKYVNYAKTPDSVRGMMICVSVYGQTGYGPLSNCIQQNPKSTSQYRTGLYSPITQTFNPTSGWFKSNNVNKQTQCANMNYQFRGTNPLATAYGPTQYGQIYRYYGGKWQIKWSNKNLINGNCYPSGDWMNASAW